MEHNHPVRDIGDGLIYLKIVSLGKLVEVKLQIRSDGNKRNSLVICVWGQFVMSRPDFLESHCLSLSVMELYQ